MKAGQHAITQESTMTTCAEHQLWCAVLEAVIRDAKKKPPRRQIESDDVVVRIAQRRSFTTTVLNWRSARDYIGSASFKGVCYLAGVNPEAASWRIRQQLPLETADTLGAVGRTRGKPRARMHISVQRKLDRILSAKKMDELGASIGEIAEDLSVTWSTAAKYLAEPDA